MGSDNGFLKSLEEKDVCVYACMLNIHIHTYIYIYFFFPHIFTYLFLLRLLSNLIFSYSLSTGKNQRLVFEYPTVIT